MNSIHKNKSSLQDIKININAKLSLLWIVVTLFYLYGDYFELYVPKKVEGILSGESLLNSPLKLFLASLLLAIPPLMVLVCILLKPVLSRWLNIIFGVFFTAIMLLIAVTSISPWYSFYVFYALVESIITSLIVWYAIGWPKDNTSRKIDQAR